MNRKEDKLCELARAIGVKEHIDGVALSAVIAQVWASDTEGVKNNRQQYKPSNLKR